MLLQTNSYVVPKDKRTEHTRLLQRFRQCLLRLGCEHFEAYEQVGANWIGTETTGRFVQLMRFRDRKHQQQVQAAERSDPTAQALIREFCELINFPYQQQQGLFAVGFYQGIIAQALSGQRAQPATGAAAPPPPDGEPPGPAETTGDVVVPEPDPSLGRDDISAAPVEGTGNDFGIDATRADAVGANGAHPATPPINPSVVDAAELMEPSEPDLRDALPVTRVVQPERSSR